VVVSDPHHRLIIEVVPQVEAGHPTTAAVVVVVAIVARPAVAVAEEEAAPVAVTEEVQEMAEEDISLPFFV
jgi:hypothetical protein